MKVLMFLHFFLQHQSSNGLSLAGVRGVEPPVRFATFAQSKVEKTKNLVAVILIVKLIGHTTGYYLIFHQSL
jgi:hypothetical protein